MQPQLIQEDQYQTQLEQKEATTLAEFAQFGVKKLGVFASPAHSYRMRAEFKIWHNESGANYAMYTPGEHKKAYIIDTYRPGSATMQDLMQPLLEAINHHPELRRKLFQANFLTTTTGEAVVTLIYHRKLDDAWLAQAQAQSLRLGVHIIGRSRKQKCVIGQDYVVETLKLENKSYHYQQMDGAFTQPNAKICQDMLNWTLANTRDNGGDLLELYCGNGNFTIPLAHQFKQVLATEIAKSSIQSALFNCRLNTVENIQFVRLASEELVQALNGVREFRRLRDVDLQSYRFSTVLVDPPRAGLDPDTLELVRRFDNVVYISCNPETLKSNLASLSETHSIESMALFDQFPFTPHRECGVILKKKFAPQ